MNDTTIAVDLAKSVFEVAASERAGHVSERYRLSRAQFLKYFAQRLAWIHGRVLGRARFLSLTTYE